MTATLLGHAHEELVVPGLGELETKRYGERQRARRVAVGEQQHHGVTAFGSKRDATNGGRPRGEIAGEPRPQDARRVDDHRREDVALDHADGDAGQVGQGRVQDEHALEIDPQSLGARPMERSSGIEKGHQRALPAALPSHGLSGGQRAKGHRGSETEAVRHGQLRDRPARQAAVRQQGIESRQGRGEGNPACGRAGPR